MCISSHQSRLSIRSARAGLFQIDYKQKSRSFQPFVLNLVDRAVQMIQTSPNLVTLVVPLTTDQEVDLIAQTRDLSLNVWCATHVSRSQRRVNGVLTRCSGLLACPACAAGPAISFRSTVSNCILSHESQTRLSGTDGDRDRAELCSR